MREAMLYERIGSGGSGGTLRCQLCAHGCHIALGQRGLCGVRECRLGRDGTPTLYALTYGKLIASHVDPIEKKPLFHVLPGSRAYSIATVGCNLTCRFCQNADISQFPRLAPDEPLPGRDVSPDEIVADAQRQGCASIAYTYTEPTVFFEYMLDTAVLAQQAGLRNVLVSNGFMSSEAVEMLAPDAEPLIHAANIDLKAFTDAFYREQCGARRQPVLDNLVALKQRGVWVEVTTLVIPGLNDEEAELRDIARFIRDGMGAETPWHVSRFYPTYRLLDRPPTPPETVRRAREIGLEEGLRHVYVGNLRGESDAESTFCPACGQRVVQRSGYLVGGIALDDHRCPRCGEPVAGLWG